MKEFNALKDILDRLLAPDGCPWDREQTLLTMRNQVLEETCEVIEAINLDDNIKIEEELGDLFFNVLFMCQLAEKEKRFTIADALNHITAKLIRRHPHIFGDAKVDTSEQVLKQWDEIKKTEHQHQSLLDNIPHELPTLARAQKIYKKIKKTEFKNGELTARDTFQDEDSLGSALFDLVIKSSENGLDPEQSLRKYLVNLEQKFRKWEEK
ncbi:MAG: MazG family protein [Parachlamydiaceae bacterium]|nr:MazG family protein [Parachlamydiaceae bacterium]